MNHKFCILLFASLFLLMFCTQSDANISNARSIGLAGAYVGLAKGVDAPLWNPANLGLSPEGRLSVTIFNFGVSVFNNSFSKQQYEKYNGAYWSENDIEDILNSIPNDGMKLSFDGAGQIASFSSGRIAFSIEALVESKVKLVKDFFDLVLYTNTNKSEHIFDDCEGEAWGIMSYNLSGALPISVPYFQQFSIGATVKYLQGMGYFKIMET